MPEFAYIAMDRTGKRANGTLSAANRTAVLDQLSARGLFPVQVEEGNGKILAKSTGGKKTKTEKGGGDAAGRVPSSAVEAFTRELANLLAGGVPLARALSLLHREAINLNAKARWQAIHDDVAGGTELAEAMAKWPQSFSNVYVAMVRAGETGGFLDVVLSQIAEFRARERDLLGKVKVAIIYPCLLTVLLIGVLIFCLTYFIPKFSGIFDQFGANLPKLTQIVVAISESFPQYGLLALLAIVLSVIGIKRAMATDVGRRRIEKVLLGTPVLGRVIARFALVRFTRMLGTLLGAGVSLVSALRVAREAIGIQTLTDAVTEATEDVQRGESLARSLGQAEKLFPPSVVEMIAVAEETGRVDAELTRIATTYEGELDRELKVLVALAEPAILIIMAAVIGTIIVAMMLPLFTLQDLIR